MATNATIASQIKRISDSRSILRDKGIALKLYVPAGTYWDDATDKDITTTSQAALKSTDQIDKVAAAFNAINVYHDSEIKVPLLIKRDGTTVVGESTSLPTGFYANALITPFITVEDKEDLVLNIQTIANQSLATQTGTIRPSAGFNYIDSLTYTIVDGAISGANVGYDNTGVTVKVETSGWLDAGDTKKVAVTTSEMSSKVGNNAATTLSTGANIVPSPLADTTLTITKGIYGSDRTLVVKSVSSQTQGDATAPDILSGKIAWVNGTKVTGSMPNYGGTASEEKYTAAASFSNHGGKLAIQPALGYYNDYSTITTGIVYNPTRTFNTTNNSATDEDLMNAQIYYETIPSGYYASEIKRKVKARDAVASVNIDYNTHKATFKVGTSGWIANDITVDINVGAAVYKQSAADLDLASHQFTVTPAMDQDGTKHNYLTQVTIDNTVIFNMLSAI
jgi:hypothetical protein